MDICKGCNDTECDNHVSISGHEDSVTVANLCEARWAEVSKTAEWLLETQYVIGVEHDFLEIIAQIKNERDYLNACDENVLPLCEVAEEGEPCTEDDELDPFYEVLDNVIDSALLGKAYPLTYMG
jgi:hypothetical protein